MDSTGGTDPYEVAGPLLRPDGEFGISDSAWAMHLLGLQRALPKSSFRAITESLPMMRAVKDDNELTRLGHPGLRRTPPTARLSSDVSRVDAQTESRLILLVCCESSDTVSSTSPSSGLVPMVQTHTMRQEIG